MRRKKVVNWMKEEYVYPMYPEYPEYISLINRGYIIVVEHVIPFVYFLLHSMTRNVNFKVKTIPSIITRGKSAGG